MMRKLTFALALLFAAGCTDRSGDDVALVASLSSFIEHEMEAKEIPSLSIALVDGDEMVWASGFGRLGAGGTGEETVYRVGSVSKLFTDIAVMQLAERGELDIDAPLAEYLPELSFAPDVTLRELMSHRAGLIREPPVGNYFDPTEPSLADTVASLDGIPLVYEPGSRTKYSNAGVALVGYVLEKTQATPFTQYVHENVLARFGMTRSSFVPPAPPTNVAAGTMWTYDGRVFEAPTFQLGMAPAGSLYATVEDLARFMSALFRGGDDVIATDTLASMFEPQFRDRDPTASYGLGFSVGELDGARMMRHGGAIYGFSTELAFLLDEKLGVVVVASKDFTNTVVGRIARHALRSLVARRQGAPLPDAETTAPLPPGRARELAGLYPDFRLVARGDRLFLDAGSNLVEVRMRGDELVVDSPLAYGRVVEVDLADRLEEGLPEVAPERFRPLIGEYGWDHNTLFVLEKDGALHALIEWFEDYPLTELGPNRFAFPDYGLYHGEELHFEDDAVIAASVRFERRDVGTDEGVTFRITPLRPPEELRAEALQASPPEEEGEYLEPDLVEAKSLDASLRHDIRYATTNNFMGAVFYDEPRAFLQRPAAEALVRAHQALASDGYGILIHDTYRPWYVTKMFWEATPEEQRIFVADPASGSRHNRGAAADITLFDRATGAPVVMVGGYDEFSPRSFPDYPGGTSRQRYLRELLRGAMEAEGFEVYEFEWWHFDYGDWRKYPILNLTFDQLDQ